MKSIIPFMLLTCTALAQVPAAVELERVNVLYIGVENPLSVVSDTVPDSCIVLRPSDGILKKVAPGKYTWFLQTDSTTVQLALTDSCSGTEIGVRTYRVKMQYEVRAVLGSKYGGVMGRGEFCAQAGIAVLLDGFDFDMRCTVKGYDVAIYKHSYGDALKLHNNGARFNASVQEKINSVTPGDRVHFYHIAYQCPGMSEPFHYAGDLHFSIK